MPRVDPVRRSRQRLAARTRWPVYLAPEGSTETPCPWLTGFVFSAEGCTGPSAECDRVFAHPDALLSLSGGWLSVSTAESSRLLSLPGGKGNRRRCTGRLRRPWLTRCYLDAEPDRPLCPRKGHPSSSLYPQRGASEDSALPVCTRVAWSPPVGCQGPRGPRKGNCR